jgi:hypothetical protein
MNVEFILHESFAESKFRIYLTKERKDDTTNSILLEDREYLKQVFFKNFEKRATTSV